MWDLECDSERGTKGMYARIKVRNVVRTRKGMVREGGCERGLKISGDGADSRWGYFGEFESMRA